MAVVSSDLRYPSGAWSCLSSSGLCWRWSSLWRRPALAHVRWRPRLATAPATWRAALSFGRAPQGGRRSKGGALMGGGRGRIRSRGFLRASRCVGAPPSCASPAFARIFWSLQRPLSRVTARSSAPAARPS